MGEGLIGMRRVYYGDRMLTTTPLISTIIASKTVC